MPMVIFPNIMASFDSVRKKREIPSIELFFNETRVEKQYVDCMICDRIFLRKSTTKTSKIVLEEARYV